MTHVMIALILDLGIRLATFVALAAAFFRKPGAGLQARNRAWGSVVAIPCCFPAGPRGRDMFFPAGRASDLAQAIDYARDYRQNRADFGAETKILPDLREARAPARLRSCRARGCQGRGRLLRRLAQGLPFGAADRRQLAFDDELAHGFSFQRSSHAIVVALLATAKISARARRRLASRRRSAGLIRNA